MNPDTLRLDFIIAYGARFSNRSSTMTHASYTSTATVSYEITDHEWRAAHPEAYPHNRRKVVATVPYPEDAERAALDLAMAEYTEQTGHAPFSQTVFHSARAAEEGK